MSDNNNGKDLSIKERQAAGYTEHLLCLRASGKISDDDYSVLLESYYNDIRRITAASVVHACDSRDRQIRKLKEQLEQTCRALEDVLGAKEDKTTRLLAANYFLSRLKQAIKGYCHAEKRTLGRRSASWPTLLFGDVRRLKFVNDTYGHEVGDTLLRAVGDMLNSTISQDDLAARSYEKGDEIVILLETDHPRSAYLAASRVRESFLVKKDWGHAVLNEFPPYLDFGGVAVDKESLEGFLGGLAPKQEIEAINELIRQWIKLADELCMKAKREKADQVLFAWCKYRAGQLVVIDHEQLSEFKLLHGLKRQYE
jgi:diguanylate cyclase (GGDEF)-like protein